MATASSHEESWKNMTADSAVERLADEFGGQLYSLGLRFCGNQAEAEDLVQEVFLLAFRAWDQFEGRSQPRTWLYTIAARACQRMHRKRSGEPDHVGSLDALLPFGEPRVAAVPADLDDGLQQRIRKEAREQLEVAIAALPDEFRIPIILKEIVGFSVPEVAQILGVNEGTIRSRVHRARLKLRAEIDAILPRESTDAPPLAYDHQTCLDLLNAKQSALDRGVAFDSDVICRRCRSVFASLDLTQGICRDLAQEVLPPDVRQRLEAALAAAPS